MQTVSEIDVQAPPRRGSRAAALLRVVAILAAACGWWISREAWLISGGMTPKNSLLTAICDAREPNSGCASLLRSSAAAVAIPNSQLRMPWAAMGMAYFSFTLVWYLLVGFPNDRGRAWHLLILAAIGVGALVSFDLTRRLLPVTPATCRLCLAAHIANAVLVVMTVVGLSVRRRAAAGDGPYPLRGHALAATLAGASIALVQLQQTVMMQVASQANQVGAAYKKIIEDAEFSRWQYARQPQRTIELREDELSQSGPAAPHTLVAYVDAQCEACAQATRMIEKVRGKHAAALRVVVRHFPQDGACNPHASGHAMACEAALAVEAVRAAKGATAALELLRRFHERGIALREAELRTFAAEAGAATLPDDGSAPASLSSGRARIDEDIRSAHELGVKSVPALFLDGRRLEYWSSDATWDALLK